MSHGISSVVLKPLLTPSTSSTILPFLYPTVRRLSTSPHLLNKRTDVPDGSEVPFDQSGPTYQPPRRKRWVPSHNPTFASPNPDEPQDPTQNPNYVDPSAFEHPRGDDQPQRKKGGAFMVRFKDYEMRRRQGLQNVPTEGYARPSAVKDLDYRDQVLKLGKQNPAARRGWRGSGRGTMEAAEDAVRRVGEKHGGVTKGEKEIFSRIFATLLEQERRLKDPALPLGNVLWGKPELKQIIYSVKPAEGPDGGPKVSVVEYPAEIREEADAKNVKKRRARAKLMTQRNKQVLKIEEQLMEELSMCQTNAEVYQFVSQNVFGLFSAAQKDMQLPSVVDSYPRLIAATMNYLRTKFQDYTGVAWIFSKLKSLGADSYVIGASGEVYSEVLAARWQGFRDLGKVVELCEEIDQNGVDPTESLVLQMREVLEQVSKNIQGVNGKTDQALHTREDIFANDELGSIVGEWGRKWFVPKLDEEDLLHEIEGLDEMHDPQL